MASSKTDWKRLETQTDEDIFKAVDNDPDTFLPDESFWKKAKVVSPQKQEITLRVDTDVLDFFKGQNPNGYQQQINSILRSFVEEEVKHHQA